MKRGIPGGRHRSYDPRLRDGTFRTIAMGCPQESRCELLPLLERELPLRLWHDLYCEGAHERCTRLRLVNAGVTPAPELLPDGRILEAAGDGPVARDDVTDSIDLAAALRAGPAR